MDFGMFPMPPRHLLLNVGFFVVSVVLFVVCLILCILVLTFLVYLIFEHGQEFECIMEEEKWA